MSMGYGKIVSDGAGNNAIAHSVNRATSAIANIPVHRCEFRTTVSMPSFTVPNDIDAFSGVTWSDMGFPQFGSFSFTEDGPVEAIRSGIVDTTDAYGYRYRVVYGLALETVGGVHTWMLQRCVYELDEPYIHTAWTAQWRTAFASTARNGTHGSLTFTPMSESAYVAWWRSVAGRGDASYQSWPSEPSSGNREDYHCWLDAAGSLTCAVDIIAQST